MLKKILLVGNASGGLYHFRKEVIEKLIEKYEVSILVGNDPYYNLLHSLGCTLHETPINYRGLNLIEEFTLFRFYIKKVKVLKPDIILTYTIKPNIYLGLICQINGIPYLTNITGLGTVFHTKKKLFNRILLILYRLGLKESKKVFFQNSDNMQRMVKNKVLKGAYELLPGSGVNIEKFSPKIYPGESDQLIFITIGRIMSDKGTQELINAARMVKESFFNVIFRLIGSVEDDNLNRELQLATQDGIIEYLGFQNDIYSIIASCHAVIHPSYHEGLSNVLLEAAATGRPIIASNIPGCRETFDEGISGFGFEPRSVNSLVDAIERFITLPYEQKVAMGLAGRKKMEREFDRQIVVDAYMREIEIILEDNEKKDKKK